MALLTATDTPQAPDARGRGIRALLTDSHATQAMRAARGRWIERTTLASEILISGKALGSLLADMVHEGLLGERPALTDRRSFEYMLLPAGAGTLQLHTEWLDAAEAIGAADGSRGELFARCTVDRFDPVILREVAAGPHRFNALLRDSRALAHIWGIEDHLLQPPGLKSRLVRLQALGLVASTIAPAGGALSYLAGPCLWHLGRLALSGALWCSLYCPEPIPPMFGELLAVVQMIIDHAPAVPQAGDATLLLHVAPPPGIPGGWADVPLRLEAGRLRLLSVTPTKPTARVQASIHVWAQALLHGSFDELEIDGDARAAHSGLSALAVPLCR